ncbi:MULTISPECIES: response regulator [Pseudanabaena]|uniref:histidine kinase n=2 Tax=Pseudanabaena TaxID=1152 RepID=L8MXK3_9CYAN|nr:MULTISPECIES: response regulator [Pseudanabaena]ELS32722.1 CheA signal transduction histidine kinase [Pseudanabaena biceps PCC 7429]MDG3495043.1 response regulator [Pseudanabaena catenata USMAC16]
MNQPNLGDFSMLDLFQMEIQSHTADMYKSLEAISSNLSAASRDLFTNLMRATHSIRGASKIVHIEAIANLTASLENCFVAFQEGFFLPKQEHIDLFHQTVDFLAEVGQVPVAEISSFLSDRQEYIDLYIQNIKRVTRAEDLQIGTFTELKTLESDHPTPNHRATKEADGESLYNSHLIESPLSDTIPDLSDFSMLDLFRMEVENQVAVLNDGLLQLENTPNAIDEIEPLMRAAHSIKGAARIVQLDVAVQLAHILEDCFVSAQSELIKITSNHIDIFLQCVDILLNVSQVSSGNISDWLTDNRDNIGEVLVAMESILPEERRNRFDRLVVAGTYTEKDKAPQAPKTTEEPQQGLTYAESSLSLVASQHSVAKPSEALMVTSEVNAIASSSSVQSTTLAKSPHETEKIAERTVKVNTDNLNRLMGLAGESLVEANWLQPFADSLLKLKYLQADLDRQLEILSESLESQRKLNSVESIQFKSARRTADSCRHFLSERLSELEVFARRSANLSDRLYREVIASHMRPFADGVQGFPRMVRDLARQLGKQVKLEIIGKSTQVDRDILEKLEAPLTHILRNALDHGLESPEARIAVGKSPEGIIRLEAMHRSGMLAITVSDDGKGLNPENIRQKIIDKKMTTHSMAAQMSEIELMDFLFLPGFSTAKQVTEVSGRGVGLDIVQNMVQQVGGIVRASSQAGKGMTFHLQLPLTLSVTRSLLVEIGGEPYAFPLSRIDHIVLVSKSEIRLIENRQYFTFDQYNIGLVVACQVLELRESQLNLEELPIIIISDRHSRYGLVVDKFLEERELVVRPLDKRLGKIPNISAAALMEDGAPILIIDVEDMVRTIDKLLTGGKLDKVSNYEDKKSIKSRKRILVVDDSITVREMERKLLENKGYEVEVAVDGMDGWNAIRTGSFNLVVSDVDMPRMNGIELVSQIKNHPNLKSIPVIIVSYKDREEDRLRGLDVGADYYLTKSSFHDNTLIQAVQDLIGV